MARVVWSAQALLDIHEIVGYLRGDSVEAAAHLGARIKESTRCLSPFPLSGRVVPELPDYGFREVMVGVYRVIYEIDNDRVQVLALLPGSQELPSAFLPPEH